MSNQVSWIERWAVRLGLLQDNPPQRDGDTSAALASAPPPDQWDDWTEIEPHGWPARRVEKHYRLIPTTCFNCESACGLLAYVDKDTHTIRKFEGNPLHPASRGRLCAKGPATINQINDPDRILHPLRRAGDGGFLLAEGSCGTRALLERRVWRPSLARGSVRVLFGIL